MIITQSIINDYLSGKASALQKQMIENWLQNQRNEELFYQYLIDFETLSPSYTADLDGALANYHQFLQRSNATVLSPVQPYKVRPVWMRWSIAAAVALLLLTSAWAFRGQWLYQTYTTAYGHTKTVTLTDGSTVVLNANSTLRVPRFGFRSDKRQVHLEGEALFSVTHTRNHQRFVVQTNHQFEVEVLGTVFDVFARQRGSKVVLNQGRVNVLLTEPSVRKRVVLKPGQLVEINSRQQVRLTETPTPENYTAWRDNRYVFDKTTVQEIGHLLRENYGLTLTTTDAELLTWTISGSYSVTNANEVLQLLEETLAIVATRQGNRVILSRPSVQQSL